MGSTKSPNKSSKSPMPMPGHDEYKVYSARWIMLLYMSLLNLLSDWTCYSVAPIAMLTMKAFGDVDPESLVTVFLGANAVASAMEPAILGRLGLRRTVVFGAMLLMVGSIIKSGGAMDLLTGKTGEETLEDEEKDETWRLYLGFFLVGLSQPLYQCTPALLSGSWFPENERTMATGVALNSNQLGIGCAFVFGTLLVSTEEDIIPYFGLLSVISTITFIGAALQFDDAPPTPPSDTARVMKGDLEIKIPKIPFLGLGGGNGDEKKENSAVVEAPAPASSDEPTEVAMDTINSVEQDLVMSAPSPAPTDEPVERKESGREETEHQPPYPMPPSYNVGNPLQASSPAYQQGMAKPNHPLQAPPNRPLQQQPYMMPPNYYYPPPPMGYYPSQGPRYSEVNPGFYHGYDEYGHYHNALIGDDELPWDFDEGVEPIMTQLDHKLDIDIRDDQLIQQCKACFARKGFAHCVGKCLCHPFVTWHPLFRSYSLLFCNVSPSFQLQLHLPLQVSSSTHCPHSWITW
jgi:hypothetical protein